MQCCLEKHSTNTAATDDQEAALVGGQRNVTSFCMVTRSVSAKHPSLIVVPFILFSLVVGLGVWGVVKGEQRSEHELRTQARLLCGQVGDTMQVEWERPGIPIYTAALMAQTTPNWTQLVPFFQAMAPGLMLTSTIEAVGLAPLGVLGTIYPPAWETLLLNSSTFNTDLVSYPRIVSPSANASVPIAKGTGSSGSSSVSSSTSEFEAAYAARQAAMLAPQWWMPFDVAGQPSASEYSFLATLLFVPANTSIGVTRSTPLVNCSDCDSTVPGYKFWGLAVAIVNLITTFPPNGPLVKPLQAGHIAYRAEVLNGDDPMFVFLESPAGPVASECIKYGVRGVVQWRLCVSPESGWRRPWLGPVIATVVIMAAIIAALAFVTQLSRLRHRMLLKTLVPKQVLKQMQADATFLQVADKKPAWQPGTCAGKILALTDDILAGREADRSAVVLIRSAVLRSTNIYAVTDFKTHLQQQDIDADVAQALMQQLGSQGAGPTFVGGNSSSGHHAGAFDGGIDDSPSQEGGGGDMPDALARGLAAILHPRRKSLLMSKHQHQVEDIGCKIEPFNLLIGQEGTDAEPAHLPALPQGNQATSFSTTRAIAKLRRLGSSIMVMDPDPKASAELKGSADKKQPAPDSPPAASSPTLQPQRPLLDQVEMLLVADSDSFHFDAFALSDASQGRPLSVLAFYLFHTSGLVRRFKLQGGLLARFLMSCEDGYKDNPYHNATHAADVLQTYHVLLTKGGLVPGYADPLTLMACYLAAVVHDFEHEGHTNDFLVHSSHPLAIMYNDKTPMENHHVAAAFRLLLQPECNFLARLSKHDADKLRKLVIDLVLGTDMKAHFALLTHFTAVHPIQCGTHSMNSTHSGSVNVASVTSAGHAKLLTVDSATSGQLTLGNSPAASGNGTLHNSSGLRSSGPLPPSPHRISEVSAGAAAKSSLQETHSKSAVSLRVDARRSSEAFNQYVHKLAESSVTAKAPIDDAERLLSLQIALKCADLGHICEGLQVHLRWVGLLEAEFFAQGDREKELGLAISPLFDRNKPGVTKSQVGFFSFVVLPLFQAFTRVFPSTLPALESTQANYAYWEKEAGKMHAQG